MNTYSPDEIFQIAEQIERNGIGYYRKACEIACGSERKKLFKELENMERQHLEDFIKIRQEFKADAADTPLDVNGEAGLYLSAIANSNVFVPDKDPAESIGAGCDIDKIIERAIDMEKNSIIFYIGLKDLVISKAGKRKVESIIQQEIKHILMLNERILK